MEHRVILGIPIDATSERETIQRIAQFCRSPGQFHVATPNPEMLVEASRNKEFKKVLQNTAMNIPDGVGLVWAMKRVMFSSSEAPAGAESRSKRKKKPLLDSSAEADSLEENVPQRVTGTDLLQKLTSPEARVCPPERIFLLGAAPGVAQRAAEALKMHNPAIKDIGTWSGSPKDEDATAIINRINAFFPTMLFVAFGAPAQDLWISRNLKHMPSVKIAMGVGGAFDFLAGERMRAPRWMQRAGIEWLWRLILEPRRIKRIWKAVVVFPWLVWNNGITE